MILLALGLGAPAVVAQEVPRVPRENKEEEQRRLHDVLREGQESKSNEETGEDVFGRSYWFEFQRRFPFDVVPAGGHKKAIAEMHALRDRLASAAEKRGASLFAATTWGEVGPTNVGGRVRALAVHPTSPEVMYIGGASGGVWKTTDGGTTWRTTFDKQTALTIGAITIDPSNPQNVYVGTGEIRVASDIGFMADGVFKSTDGGETWRNIGLNTLSSIAAIHVHKNDPNIIYVASGRLYSSGRYTGGGLGTGNGFYRSTDAGTTWSQIVSGHIVEMAVNPSNNDEVFITSSRAIQRSRNAGATFTQVNSGLAQLSSSIRMSITHDPSEPTRLYVLQAYAAAGGMHGANFYRSTNSGDSWTLVRGLDGGFFRNQGEYNNCIAVDPSNPDIILTGGIDLWRTTDGGDNWANVTNTRGSTFNNQLAHPDHHIIAFDPSVPGVVYVGNDGGVYQSFSSGADWRRLHSNLPITQFHAIELDQTRPYRVFGGTQDNQSQVGLGTPTGYTKDWTSMIGGDGFWVVVDLVDPNFVYAESQYGEVRRINVNDLDGPKYNMVALIENDGGAWSTPIAMSPVDKRFYTARTNIYRTSTPRASVVWEKLTTGFGGGSKATALSLSPFDGRKLIVGNESGNVRYSTNDGATWLVSTGLPSRFNTDLMWDPTETNRVYATFSGFRTGHVFVSNNNGQSFTDISGNLPDVPVNAIEIDPTDNRKIFVGTDVGVFVSLQGGRTWFPFNEGFPVVPVADMKIHRTRRVLVAGTHGRSIFDVSIDNITVPPVLIAPVGGETFPSPDTITVHWAGFTGPVNVYLSNRTGEPFNEVASNVVGDSVRIEIPFLRTTTARIRVDAVGGGPSVMSGDITFNPAANVETLGSRGFIAEAIALRNGQLWTTSRTSDTIRRLRTPLLSGSDFVVRTGFTGRIRGLAYDAQADWFYALVTNDDDSSPRVYRMDTTGAMLAEITLPASITAATGIDVAPNGIALSTPGVDGRIVIVDPTSGAEVSSSPYRNVRGDWRRGLVWNGRTYTQGVVRSESGVEFPSELQQLSLSPDSARLYEALPVVVSSGRTIYFVDLAVDESQAGGEATYYATDTAGVIYRFRGSLFSSVETGSAAVRRAGVRIARVTPNPFRGDATIALEMLRSDNVTLDLLSATGQRMLRVYDGRVEEGTHEHRINGELLASGVYYLVATTGAGDRVTTPVVVTR